MNMVMRLKNIFSALGRFHQGLEASGCMLSIWRSHHNGGAFPKIVPCCFARPGSRLARQIGQHRIDVDVYHWAKHWRWKTCLQLVVKLSASPMPPRQIGHSGSEKAEGCVLEPTSASKTVPCGARGRMNAFQ